MLFAPIYAAKVPGQERNDAGFKELILPWRERAGEGIGVFGTAVRGWVGASSLSKLFHAMFPVIIPQTKHASSLATAATATFFFFPWWIIL